QARLAAWICGMAANVARAQIRLRLRDSKRVRALVTVPEPATEVDASDPERVGIALAELPERYEAALRAKYFEQLSVAAMAAASCESEKAVESLLTRARQAFREAYSRCGETP